MKDYFKKFSIMFVIALALVLGSSNSAFAADDGVIGVTNLNNTTMNSAKVGDVLNLPEIGWKRYDDKNLLDLSAGFGQNVGFVSTGDVIGQQTYYKKTYTYFGGSDLTGEGSWIKFNFKGSKLRIISGHGYLRSNGVLIKIDGIKYRYDTYAQNIIGQVISFEKIDLENKEHMVEISVDSDSTIYIGDGKNYKASDIDAIDIDKDGEILPPKQIDVEPETPVYKSGALLIINLTDGETKVFDVANSEITKFKNWYNTKSEYENKLTYEFNKTVNSYISVEENVVHEKITSYEIRKY
jgi:hypothetical protein